MNFWKALCSIKYRGSKPYQYLLPFPKIMASFHCGGITFLPVSLGYQSRVEQMKIIQRKSLLSFVKKIQTISSQSTCFFNTASTFFGRWIIISWRGFRITEKPGLVTYHVTLDKSLNISKTCKVFVNFKKLYKSWKYWWWLLWILL